MSLYNIIKARFPMRIVALGCVLHLRAPHTNRKLLCYLSLCVNSPPEQIGITEQTAFKLQGRELVHAEMNVLSSYMGLSFVTHFTFLITAI